MVMPSPITDSTLLPVFSRPATSAFSPLGPQGPHNSATSREMRRSQNLHFRPLFQWIREGESSVHRLGTSWCHQRPTKEERDEREEEGRREGRGTADASAEREKESEIARPSACGDCGQGDRGPD